MEQENKILFNLLNANKCQYVVFDIDSREKQQVYYLFILHSDFDKTLSLMNANNIRISVLNDYCLYGLKKIRIIEIDNNIYYLFERPSTRSLDNSWVPFNKIVESNFLNNRLVRAEIPILSHTDEFFYLICKNVFNNRDKGFDKKDLRRIEELKSEVDLRENPLVEMFGSVFYKFLPVLIELIESGRFDIIYINYLSFVGY